MIPYLPTWKKKQIAFGSEVELLGLNQAFTYFPRESFHWKILPSKWPTGKHCVKRPWQFQGECLWISRKSTFPLKLNTACRSGCAWFWFWIFWPSRASNDSDKYFARVEPQYCSTWSPHWTLQQPWNVTAPLSNGTTGLKRSKQQTPSVLRIGRLVHCTFDFKNYNLEKKKTENVQNPSGCENLRPSLAACRTQRLRHESSVTSQNAHAFLTIWLVVVKMLPATNGFILCPFSRKPCRTSCVEKNKKLKQFVPLSCSDRHATVVSFLKMAHMAKTNAVFQVFQGCSVCVRLSVCESTKQELKTRSKISGLSQKQTAEPREPNSRFLGLSWLKTQVKRSRVIGPFTSLNPSSLSITSGTSWWWILGSSTTCLAFQFNHKPFTIDWNTTDRRSIRESDH